MAFIKELSENFRNLGKNSNKIIKLLNTYHQLKEDPVANAYLLEKRLSEMMKIRNNLPDFKLKEALDSWLKEEQEELEKIKEDFRFRFGQSLSELFRQDGIAVKGQYPTLRIGLYTLKLNFDFGDAALYFGPEVEKIRSKIDLEPQKIYQTIKKYDRELKKERFEPQEFLRDLATAYKRRIVLTNKSTGEKILILDLLHEFVVAKQPPQFFIDPKKENFQEFPRIRFAYWLYLLKNTGLTDKGIRLYVATFDATIDKKRSIWIPDNDAGEGTYYSYIAFEKVENTQIRWTKD